MRKWRGLAPLEKDELTLCDEMMKGMGWTVVRTARRGGRGVNRTSMVSKGLPDRKYYRNTDTFWFEAKAEDGRQSDAQKAFQEMCERAGELYVIGGMVELKAFLKQWGERVRKHA
jgi:hypothetical protein